MTEEQDRQQERFKQAVDEKSAQAREAAEATSAEAHSSQPDQDDRPQGVLDPRKTNTGHGKKTADKWNQ